MVDKNGKHFVILCSCFVFISPHLCCQISCVFLGIQMLTFLNVLSKPDMIFKKIINIWINRMYINYCNSTPVVRIYPLSSFFWVCLYFMMFSMHVQLHDTRCSFKTSLVSEAIIIFAVLLINICLLLFRIFMTCKRTCGALKLTSQGDLPCSNSFHGYI